MNILFVCTGNVSRSYLAETLFRNEARLNDLKGIAVSSAGTNPYNGAPADPRMVNYLYERGVPIESHEARTIIAGDVKWADLILVMEKIHREIIGDRWPESKNKIELLAAYISSDTTEDDISDPYGRTRYHYRLAQSQITLAVRGLIKRFLSDQKRYNA